MSPSGIALRSQRRRALLALRPTRAGCELACEIIDGRLGRLLKNPTYAGVTPQFWSSLDAVCSQSEWRPWGLRNCGKGEPGQVMAVSHGTAPARFRDVEVGLPS